MGPGKGSQAPASAEEPLDVYLIMQLLRRLALGEF
jgi:hypothetical protein